MIFGVLRVGSTACHTAIGGVTKAVVVVKSQVYIFGFAVVFSLMPVTHSAHHQGIKPAQPTGSGNAGQPLFGAAQVAGFHAHIIRLVFIHIIARRFGAVNHCAAQCAAAGGDRISAFADGYLAHVLQFGSVAVGVEVAICAKQFLESRRRAAFTLVEAVHYDSYAIFIHAADTETIGAGTAAFGHTDAGIVAHHIADVLHHFFIQLLAADAFAAKLARRMPATLDFDGFQLGGTGIVRFTRCPNRSREDAAQSQEQNTWPVLMDRCFHDSVSELKMK